MREWTANISSNRLITRNDFAPYSQSRACTRNLPISAGRVALELNTETRVIQTRACSRLRRPTLCWLNWSVTWPDTYLVRSARGSIFQYRLQYNTLCIIDGITLSVSSFNALHSQMKHAHEFQRSLTEATSAASLNRPRIAPLGLRSAFGSAADIVGIAGRCAATSSTVLGQPSAKNPDYT
jgi:hypothetical protein